MICTLVDLAVSAEPFLENSQPTEIKYQLLIKEVEILNRSLPVADLSETAIENKENPSPCKDESSAEDPMKSVLVDPTRYGDWEINGRCIDF